MRHSDKQKIRIIRFCFENGLHLQFEFQLLLFRACRMIFKCDGTRAETRFRLSAKRMSSFKSAGASVQSPTGSRGVRISGIHVGYTMFRGSVKSTGYPLHRPLSPSPPLLFVTVCHHISARLCLRPNLSMTPEFEVLESLPLYCT